MINKKRFGKKGESTPITIILLVLIALVLIVILWNLIMGLIKRNTETQELQASMMIVNMDIDNIAADNFTEPQYVNITLRRGGGQDILVNRTEIKKYADIVFIIDSTSSMQDEINSVSETINGFVTTLTLNKINYTFALVEFKDIAYFSSTYYQQGISSDFPFRVHNFSTMDPAIVSNFTIDPEEFKSKLAEITSNIKPGSGGDWAESMLNAINASTYLNFRNIPNTGTSVFKKIFIVISDSPPHAYDCTCDYTTSYMRCYPYTTGTQGTSYNYEIRYYDKIRGAINLTNITSYQLYPFMGNNSVLWMDYRSGTNYEIIMCNLSGSTSSTDFTEWCSANGPGFNNVTRTATSDYTPVINEDDSIIAWRDVISSTNQRIKWCNLNGKGDATIQTWCSSTSYGLKTLSTSGINFAPDISRKKVVWQEYIGGGLDKNSNGGVELGGNSEVYLFDPTLSTEEIHVSNDQNLSLEKVLSAYINDQTPRFNYTNNYPKNPKIFGSRIVWQDCRNSTGGIHSCNYDIYMCDISGLSASDIPVKCSTKYSNGGKLMKITENFRTQINPDIDGDIIAWADNRDNINYLGIYLCNISGILEPNIEAWCQDTGLTKVAYEASYNLTLSVSGDVIAWIRGNYGPVSLCNISLRNNEPIFDWCRSTAKGLKIAESYSYPANTPSVNGERVTYYQLLYNSSGTSNTRYQTFNYLGYPYFISNMSDYLVLRNFTMYYINKPYDINLPEGICKNGADKDMAIRTGGKYYSYDQASEINKISESLLDEINEYFRKDIYDHINIIFYNATKNYILVIDEVPRPLEQKKYSIPKQGGLAGNITNITMIEVYIASYTRESHREVIGPLLSRWVRRD